MPAPSHAFALYFPDSDACSSHLFWVDFSGDIIVGAVILFLYFLNKMPPEPRSFFRSPYNPPFLIYRIRYNDDHSCTASFCPSHYNCDPWRRDSREFYYHLFVSYSLIMLPPGSRGDPGWKPIRTAMKLNRGRLSNFRQQFIPDWDARVRVAVPFTFIRAGNRIDPATV